MTLAKYSTAKTIDDLKTSILIRDSREIGRIVDRLRFRFRMNYESCWRLANRLTGIERADWDELLFETDMQE